MAKSSTTKAVVYLSNGYSFEIYISDDCIDSVSTDFTEAMEKKFDTFWLGNWGDQIEVALLNQNGRIVKYFRDKANESLPIIILNQVVTYTGI